MRQYMTIAAISAALMTSTAAFAANDSVSPQSHAQPNQASESTLMNASGAEQAKAQGEANAAATSEAAKNTQIYKGETSLNTSVGQDSATVSAMNDSIANLPKEGEVELNGVVDDVDGENKFTLRDAQGKTIDVQTASNTTLSKGDKVSVNGSLTSRMLGFGRKIEDAKVLVVSSASNR